MNTNKVAVVCGDSAVGSAIALALCQAGMNIALLGQSQIAIDRALEAFPETGVWGRTYDALNEESVLDAIDDVIQTYGRIDVLVNANLTIACRPCKQMSPNTFDEMMAANPRAYFLMARACIPHMAKVGHGRIINLSSTHSHVADGYHAEYAMATSAINALTREMAANYWKDNIQMIALVACFIDEQFPDALDMQQRQAPEEISLLGRRVTPTDIARSVRFFATSRTRCVTGSEIRSDAGYLTTQYRVGNVPFTKITD